VDKLLLKLAVTSTSLLKKDRPNMAKTLQASGYKKVDLKEWETKDKELMNKNIGKYNKQKNVAKGVLGTMLGTIGAAGGAGIGHITSSKLLDGKKWPMVAGAAVGAVLGGVAGSKSINEDAIKSKLTKYRLSRAAVTDKARRGKYDFYVKD